MCRAFSWIFRICLHRPHTRVLLILPVFTWNSKWKYSWKTCFYSYIFFCSLPPSPLFYRLRGIFVFFSGSLSLVSTNRRWYNGNAIKYAQICSAHLVSWNTDTGSTFAIVTTIKIFMCIFYGSFRPTFCNFAHAKNLSLAVMWVNIYPIFYFQFGKT